MKMKNLLNFTDIILNSKDFQKTFKRIKNKKVFIIFFKNQNLNEIIIDTIKK